MGDDERFEHLSLVVEDPTWGTLRFDALAAGPTDGTPVLLLHGFPQTSWAYHHQLEALGADGYRAVAFDQRGYSPGARPGAVEAYGNDALVADVVAVADALGWERFHLVGHDWGGAVAWLVAGTHGERLLSLTVLSTPHPRAFARALFGTDTPPTADAEGAAAAAAATGSEQAGRSAYIAMFQAEGAEVGMLANEAAGLRLVLQGTGLSAEESAPYLEALGTPEALGAALNWYRAASVTAVERMGPVTVPTLYVWSTNDPALGRDAAEATGSCVDGPYRFEVLEGVSHWIAEQAPEDTNRLLLEHLALA